MSLFRSLFSRRKRRPVSRLHLECLEDRAVPASVFSVNQFEDNIRNMFVGNSVGFAYAINQNGVTVRADGVGDARMDDEGQEDFTEDTRMTSASVAKTITATAILKILQDDPGVSLGSSISPYLPSDWDQGPNISSITFRDLLTHRSGLRRVDFDGNGGADLNEQTLYSGLQQLIALGVDGTDADSNGTIDLKEQFSYENANFALMRVMTAYLLGDGDAADDAANPAQYTADYYVDFVSDEILDPMGINNADTAAADNTPVLNYVSPNGGSFVTYTDRTLWAGGEGWWMSANDYAKFLIGINDDTVLWESTRDLMQDQFLGLMNPDDWNNSIRVSGMFGNSYSHGGDLNNLKTAIGSFPGGIQAALLVNSSWDPNAFPHPSSAHQVQLLQVAYENAWTEIEVSGTSGPDSFVVRANANDPDAIDILVNGDLVVTRWVETLDTLTLNGLGGNDTFEIRVLPASIDLEIEGGSGNDDVHLADDIDDGPAQFDLYINGNISFDGGSGTDTLTFNDASNYGDDTYTVTDTSIDKSWYTGIVTFADLEEVHLYTGHEDDNILVHESDAGTDVYVYSGDGNDTFTLGNQNLSVNLGDSVFLDGGDDEDHVIFSDQNGAGPLDWYVFQSDHYSQSGSALIHYDAVENLTLQSTNLDSIVNVQGVANGVTLTINGRDGEDTVRIHATSANSSVIFNGGDHDDTLELTPDGGDLSQIDGLITFTAGSGTDELVINDEYSVFSDSYFITDTTFDKSNFVQLNYSGVQAIELTANDSDNVINIFSLGNVDLNVYTRDGDDEIYVSPVAGDLDSDILGDLYIHGGDGDDLLMLTDDGDLIGNDSYTFSGNTFDKTGLVDPWTYIQTEHVIFTANPQDNVITLSGTTTVDLTVNAGGGNDTIHIGTGRADIMHAEAHIDGGSGTDTIHVNAEDTPGGHNYTFTGAAFDMNSYFFGSLTWEDTTYFVLHAGEHADTITVNSSPATTQLSLFGNGGNDTFHIGAGDLDDIGGNVGLNGGLGVDVATVNDSTDVGNDAYTITATTLSKPGFLLTYLDLTSLTLLANTANNTINVNDTLASLALVIEAGAGNDILHLAPLTMNLAFIAGPVTFRGQLGTDTAYLHDENNGAGATYTLTKTTVTRPGFGGFTHDTTEHLHLLMGNGNDTANLLEFSPTTTIHLFGRGGNDTFNLYVSPPLAGKGGGRVNVDGGSNAAAGDLLNVYYTGLPTIKHTPTLLVPGSGTADLTYLDVLFSIGYTATEAVKLIKV